MLEAVTPDQFEAIEIKNPKIDAIVTNKGIIKLMGKDRLTQMVIEEVTLLMGNNSLLDIKLSIRLISTKSLEVPDDSFA